MSAAGLGWRSRWIGLLALALALGVVLSVTAQQGSPERPTGLTATASHDHVALQWDDPGDASISGYQILQRQRDTDAPGVFAVLVEDTGEALTSYVDRTVTASTRYVYRVKAHNAYGLSAQSSYANADTLARPSEVSAPDAPVVPARPSGLTAAASDAGVALSWADPGDSSVTGYQILRRQRDTDAPGVFSVLTEDTGEALTSYVDSSVTPGTRYVYRVKARNAGGLSAQSSYANATAAAQAVAGAPAAPSGLRAEATMDTVRLSWEDAGDSSVTGYQILRQAPGAAAAGHVTVVVEDTGAPEAGYADASVERETDYVYQVIARNASGQSEPASVSVTTPGYPPLSADTDPADLVPTNVRVEREHKLIRLYWDPPAAGAHLVTGYQVLEEQVGGDGAVRTIGIFVSLPERTSFTYLPARLEDGRRYSFQVTALRGESVSLPSDPASFRVRAGTVRAEQVDSSGLPVNELSDLPAAPVGLGATVFNGQVRLAWTAPAEAQPGNALPRLPRSADRAGRARLPGAHG